MYGSRTATNGTATETAASGAGSAYSYPSAWMMLQRNGNTIKVATSPDDVTWTQLASITLSNLPLAVQVGVFSSSGSTSATSQATISNFDLVPLQSRYEGELLTVVANSAVVPRIATDTAESAGATLIQDGTAVGDFVTVLVPSVLAGTYDVRIGIKKYPNRGISQLAIGRSDNFTGTVTNVGAPYDEYIATQSYTEVDLGNWAPGTSSDKWFRFTITGKNASSTSYVQTIDYITLIPK